MRNQIQCAVLFISILLISSCKQKHQLFTRVSASSSSVDFENKVVEKPGLSILSYLYFYNGAGVSAGDINNDGLADLFFAANSKGNNKLYLNTGDFKFEDITDKAGVRGLSDWCTGTTMADVNGDGKLDIYVSSVNNLYGLTGHNELYINNGDLTFSEKSAEYGLDVSCTTTQTAFFDYDHDGDLDCYILNQSQHPHANIVDTSNRNNYDSLSGDRFYRNDLSTSGKFTDVSKQSGIYQSNLGYGLGIAVADFNNDGWEDVYIGNDFHENDYYYLNNGNGSFTESGSKHFKHYSRFSMGNDAADYNNDGQLDLISVDMLPDREEVLKTYGSDENADIYKIKLEKNGYQDQYSKNCLQRNNGNGNSFSETALLSGVAATDWSWSPLFADFNNDGNKDLFISSGIVKRPVDLDYIRFLSSLDASKGLKEDNANDRQAIDPMPEGSSHPFFFQGDGKLSFKDVSDDWGTADLKGFYTGAAYADLDNDGNLDIAVNCINDKALLLKNNAIKKNIAAFSFKGTDPNTNGIGVKLYLFSGGTMQYQQVMSTRGFQSSVEPKLHFGIGDNSKIDSVIIVWPKQQFQVLKNVPVNKTVEIKQQDAAGVFNSASFFPPASTDLTDVTETINIAWKHTENDFNDFNQQYLIPHKLSSRGPKIAVGDVNRDGLEDFYVCGSAGQEGALFQQAANGTFSSTNSKLFEINKDAEEVDAIFFDANKDGADDLYVVCGGNEFDDGSPLLSDKLYLNDGKGNFSNNTDNAIPAVLKNKSCIAVADIDKDGDNDIFLGGLADAGKYGVPQASYLLLNDGAGIFSQAGKTIMGLDSLGMVTSAGFSDINNDGWQDLVVTGEWMPLKIFINQQGKFSTTDINASTGLWQSLLVTDINGDGNKDILAGNFGYNTRFHAGKQGPLKMYLKDFDRNGTLEQIVTYTINNEEYTFLAKDELERALPILKKAYLKYSEVAGKSVQYMFYELFKDYRELKAEELGSCCFINDGKGSFQKRVLPPGVQLAPVYSFASAPGKNAFIAMGNLYGVIPYEGRYDALQPVKMFFDTRGEAKLVPSFNLPVNGEVRDAKWIKTSGNKQILVIARNNQQLLFFKPVD